MPLDPEDRDELKAVIIEALAEAAHAAKSADSPEEAAAAIEEAVDEAVEQVEDVTEGEGDEAQPGDTDTGSWEEGDDAGPAEDHQPGLTVAPVVDSSPQREHPYWKTLRLRK